MQRETGTIFLPTRRRIDVAALARTCGLPWRKWSRGAIARAERSANGHVHLVVVRARRGGVAISVTGMRAADTAVLGPIAARVRRALPLRNGAVLRGTSPFEDAVATALNAADTPPRTRRAVYRLGSPCPGARRMRAMPEPRALRIAPLRAAGASPDLARRLQTIGQTFAASGSMRS